ncbi:MAG TPA: aldo/keto reductase [Clostridiales bacterium]|nr:aldo/keto reductase [Clostridiales bacterium]
MRSADLRTSSGVVTLSKVILGSCYFGTDISKEESFRLLDLYYELGGRTIDTARVYASWLPNGEQASEFTIGEWIRRNNNRRELTIITKGGHPPLDNMYKPRLSAECLTQDLHESLDALGTGYVDIYLLHRDHEDVPVEEIIDTLDSFVKQGLVRAIGASNWSLDRILEANNYALKKGKTPFCVSQIQWSLAFCTPETWGDDTLKCMDRSEYEGYLKNNIPVMAYSPQAKGFFSKYIENGLEGLNPKIIKRFVNETNLKRAERVKQLSKKTGYSPAAIAISFITSNPLEGFAVVGCSKCEQLADTIKGADVVLDSKTIDWLENG